MNITWNIHKPTGRMIEYCLGVGARNRKTQFIQNVEETGHIFVRVLLRTKTTLSITMWSKDLNYSADFIPAGSDLKYHHVCKNNPFGGKTEWDNLKLMKTQRLPELKRHLQYVIDSFELKRDEVVIEISTDINELIN